MYGPTADIVISLLRHLLMLIAGLAVHRGWIEADVSTQLVGAIIALVSVLLSAFFHAASNGTIQTLSTKPNALPTETPVQ